MIYSKYRSLNKNLPWNVEPTTVVTQFENQQKEEFQQQLMVIWDEIACIYPAICGPTKFYVNILDLKIASEIFLASEIAWEDQATLNFR